MYWVIVFIHIEPSIVNAFRIEACEGTSEVKKLIKLVNGVRQTTKLYFYFDHMWIRRLTMKTPVVKWSRRRKKPIVTLTLAILHLTQVSQSWMFPAVGWCSTVSLRVFQVCPSTEEMSFGNLLCICWALFLRELGVELITSYWTMLYINILSVGCTWD